MNQATKIYMSEKNLIQLTKKICNELQIEKSHENFIYNKLKKIAPSVGSKFSEVVNDSPTNKGLTYLNTKSYQHIKKDIQMQRESFKHQQKKSTKQTEPSHVDANAGNFFSFDNSELTNNHFISADGTIKTDLNNVIQQQHDNYNERDEDIDIRYMSIKNNRDNADKQNGNNTQYNADQYNKKPSPQQNMMLTPLCTSRRQKKYVADDNPQQIGRNRSNTQNMNGMNGMNGMEGMQNMNGMNGMSDMNGMGDMNGISSMDNMQSSNFEYKLWSILNLP